MEPAHSRLLKYALIAFICAPTCALLCGPAWAQPTGGPLVISAVSVKPAPVVDGKLDDACWSQASRLEEFFCPNTDVAPPEKTVALICVDERALYLAFECYDRTPGDIAAKETRRNGDTSHDDFVIIALDPWHKHGDTYQFIVNATGTQAEQIPGGSATKIEWRGDWSGAAVRTSYGWSAEMAIPYSILRYSPGQDTFGMLVGRAFAKENIMAISPVTGHQVDEKLAVDLTGLHLPRSTSRPVVMSYSTFDSEPGAGMFNAGVDVQYKLTNGLTALGTMNPDFKQVEDVIEPVSFSYTERYLPDQRPFFITGQDGFLPREHLLYTRRIEEFDTGVKLFGTVGNESMGLLDALTYDRQNVLAASWKHRFSDADTAKLLFVSDARTGDPSEVGYGGTAFGIDACHNRTTSEGSDSIWFVGYLAHSEETGDGTVASLGGSHGRGSGRLFYDWMITTTSRNFNPSLGLWSDTNCYGGSFSVGKWTRQDGGRLESRAWNVGVNYLNALDDSEVLAATVTPSMNWAWRNGRWLDVGVTRGEQYGFDGSDVHFGYGWKSNDLYHSGNVYALRGARAGGDYSYCGIQQGFRFADRLSVKLGAEYGSLAGSPEDDGRHFQGVLTSSYDITTERSLGLRVIAREDGVTGYAAYRQVVRRGLDVYVLFGDPDPNLSGFSPRMVVKLVRTL